MRRWALLVVVIALASASCGPNGVGAEREDLGADTPVCDQTGASLILSIQAVPDARYAPCIKGLRAGWEYVPLQARSGESVFWLDSDRLGARFLEVRLLPACDPSGAVEVESDEPGVPLFVDVDAAVDIPVTVIPDSRNLQTADHAAGIQGELEGLTIADRTLTVDVDSSNLTTAQRLANARALGHAVLIVSARDAEDGTATLVLPGDDEEYDGLHGGDVLDALAQITEPASYTGTWYYPFPNGCIVYSFDAHGTGIDTILADVQASLGLFDAEALRQIARDEGYDI